MDWLLLEFGGGAGRFAELGTESTFVLISGRDGDTGDPLTAKPPRMGSRKSSARLNEAAEP